MKETTATNEDRKTASNSRRVEWRGRFYAQIAGEIASLARFAATVVQFAPRKEDDGLLRRLVSHAAASAAEQIEVADTAADLAALLGGNGEKRAALVLLNGNFNYDKDIQGTLQELKPALARGDRVSVVLYNSYVRSLYLLANKLGLRRGEVPTTFLTRTSLANVAALAGFELVRLRPCCYVPCRWFGVGPLLNRILPLVPLLRWSALTAVATLRPLMREEELPTLSIVIPARNEAGNIENALKRLSGLPEAKLEILFVEGHSTDNTWEEIERCAELYRDRFALRAFRQTGKGKNDAVRLGFSQASGELLTILDADLTMPPELLGRFYEAYCRGLGDFINGSRLVYPMEKEAMRFLNHLGNIFFAKALSWVLDVPISDSLCGTKLITRRDYERICRWREVFGDFDPFGDFELLFAAAELGLGVIDIPIAYRDREYGTTNISRFSHGWMLLKMTMVGLGRIKTGKAGLGPTAFGE